MFPPNAIDPSDAPTISRRDRKKLRTRNELMQAAVRLFAVQGYENTSISEITEAVDVSPRTFFRYFTSKDDVLFPEVDHEPYLARVRAQPTSVNDVDAVRDAYLSLLPLPKKVAQRTLLFKRALAGAPALHGRNLMVQQDFRDQLAQALADRRGLHRPDERLVVAASMAQLALRLAFDRWTAEDGRPDLGDLITEYFGFVHSVAGSGPAVPTSGWTKGATT
jgi:AcrR family transcriptional regulator